MHWADQTFIISNDNKISKTPRLLHQTKNGQVVKDFITGWFEEFDSN